MICETNFTIQHTQAKDILNDLKRCRKNLGIGLNREVIKQSLKMDVPYSQKVWQGIKFGGLVVTLYNRRIKTHQIFLKDLQM